MFNWLNARWRGVMFAVIIGIAALFISANYGGPSVLYAMLLGMAFNFMSDNEMVRPGIELCAGPVLRFGVALLGVRITAEELSHLSPTLLLIILGGVFATIVFSTLIRRFFDLPKAEGALAGASVAICGASAAIALSLVVDKKQLREQTLLAVVVVVTILSTIAMVLYPLALEILHLNGSEAGLVLGGTIHDVSQVVGAGAMMGQEALATATMTKMLRVAMLVPMIMIFAVVFKEKSVATGEGKPKKINITRVIPTFLIAFVILAVVNVAGFIPFRAADFMAHISQLCILISIAALGMKTVIGRLRTVGLPILFLMTIDTLFLFVWVLGGILLTR